jgi:arylsulfatase A-like enzyme
VDVRTAGAEWIELLQASLPALEGGTAQAWRELSADLSSYAGGEIELRFRSWLGAAAPEDASLLRGELLWGVPMIFAPRASDPRPNLVLVTLDTLRADAVGAYSGGDSTPFLDELAANSWLFEDTWTACNSTLPSHTSMLTGVPVPTHGVLDNSSSLAPEVKTLAQALREAGYTTAAAVSVEHLQPAWSGLGRGFDRFLEVRPGASVDGALTLAPVARWLDELSGENERPVFLWVHLFDPHTPYGPPASFLREFEAQLVARGGEVPSRKTSEERIGQTTSTAAGGFLEGVDNPAYAAHLYAAGVAYTDALMRGFVTELDRSGLGARSAMVVTADHGESLGEHDVWYGHQRLHPAVMEIPLLLRLPADAKGERPHGRVPTRASTLDIAATFLDQAGLPPLSTFGTDLTELAALPEREERRVWFVHASGAQAGCRDQDAHYWRNLVDYEQLGEERWEPAGKDSLFLLASDPGAERDVSEEQPRLATRYRELLEAWLPSVAGGRQISADIDPQQADRLRALGYTGGE